jgi:hypothetical protein
MGALTTLNEPKKPFMKINPLRLAGIALLLFAASCQKENSAPGTVPATVAEATANEVDFFESADDDLGNAAGIDGISAGESIGIYGDAGFGLFPMEPNNPSNPSRCFTITVTPKERGVFPKTVTLDFGAGCEMNGHVRKGKIITVYSGPLHKPGNKAMTEFDGYYVDGRKIEGRHQIENTTTPGANNRQFTRTYTKKITSADGQSWKSWAGTTIMTQVEGNGTPLWPVDDVFQITGTRNGQSSNGRTWVAEVTNPLVKAFTCRWISKGILKISINDNTGVLDFGNGSCDNEATLTVNGATRTIKLR